MAKHRVVDGVEEKFCGVCGRWLPLTEFYKSRIAGDGLQVNCKKCKLNMARKASDKVNASSRRSYARRREGQLAIRKARRAKMVESDIRYDESFQKRYWEKVEKGDGCWEWQASLNKGGYGQIGFKGGIIYAHRAAWILTNGPIPDGLFVCHHCDNRKCCNPEHFFLGTFKDNMDDKVAKGRTAHLRGELNHTSILTEVQVKEIRRRYKEEDISHRELAEEYGVAKPTISALIQNRTWHDDSYTP